MGQECYEIHIKGHMGADWSDWFDGLTVANLDGGEALLSGPVADQAALHGVLARLHALNLTLLGLRRVGPDHLLDASKTRSACDGFAWARPADARGKSISSAVSHME